VITATALLQLHEKGLFSLQDATNGYLPFVVENPNFTTPITFQMLLTHTSGIADGTALDDQYYYGKDSPISLRYFLENYLVPGGRVLQCFRKLS
jgi:CubicO group peptidase (beta-lactamase class C family)